MSKEQKTVLDWLKKEIRIVGNYSKAIERLIELGRDKSNKEESKIYEMFCYMDDHEWAEVKDTAISIAGIE